jgi:hypothetical protein
MKRRHPIALTLLLTAVGLAVPPIQAELLDAEQKSMLQARLGAMSAEEVDHVRHDPRARIQFLRGIASSMTPEQRESFRDSWREMTAEERQQTLNDF